MSTHRSAAYSAAIVAYADRPNECTIYPTDAPSHQRTTAWVSAVDGSYVDLGDVR